MPRRVTDAARRHFDAALARLAPGRRLVAITGQALAPDRPTGAEALARLRRDRTAHIVFSAALDVRLFAPHGTRVATRLTVIDRVPAPDPDAVKACSGRAETAAALLALVRRHVPPRWGRSRLEPMPTGALAGLAAPMGPERCPHAPLLRSPLGAPSRGRGQVRGA